MRTQAELHRMSTGQWGVAVTIKGQDSTDGGRWHTQTLDRFSAEEYRRKIAVGVSTLLRMSEKDPTNRVRDGSPINVAAVIGDEVGRPFPHSLSYQQAVKLLGELDRCILEIRAREKNGTLYSKN